MSWMRWTILGGFACAALAAGGAAPAAETIGVDAGRVVADVTRKPLGFVSCWLLDSDLHRPRPVSMVEVYKTLGVGSLRFPYGALGNNYLWTTPPYDKAAEGLKPRVAAMGKTPGAWDWAVNPDGTFKKSLDFDEFIGQCRAASIEPVIVINVLSCNFEGGPTREQLREAAAEWVRYSNKVRGYGVKYWQLGNEQEHHAKEMPLEEYQSIYGEFTQAMLAVDPSIRVGPSFIGSDNWTRAIISAFPDRVHFVAAHQYQWKKWTREQWLALEEPVIPNIIKIKNAIEKSAAPQAEILVTETNATGNWADDGKGAPDTMRTLCLAEMLLHMCAVRQVAYVHFWGTHSPWNGENDEGGAPAALYPDNRLKPAARLIGMINHSLLDQMVETDRVSGPIRAFAGRSAAGDRLVAYVINKSDKPVDVAINPKGFTPGAVESIRSMIGASYEDLEPVFSERGEAKVAGGGLTVVAPGLSVTAVTVSGRP